MNVQRTAKEQAEFEEDSRREAEYDRWLDRQLDR